SPLQPLQWPHQERLWRLSRAILLPTSAEKKPALPLCGSIPKDCDNARPAAPGASDSAADHRFRGSRRRGGPCWFQLREDQALLGGGVGASLRCPLLLPRSRGARAASG